MYQSLIRPFLFQLSPEKAHHFSFRWLKILFAIPGIRFIAHRLYVVNDPRLEVECMGLKFKNPVGLAAGFDKDAVLYNELSAFGFGCIEIGTITPMAQPGNPQPRLFRLPKDQSLINRMGFNNLGVEVAVERLKKKSTQVIVGGNIGKNKQTPNEQAVDDYLKSFKALYPHVDYFVVNVSSPNTPNLRELQEKKPLKALLMRLKQEANTHKKPKPIMLKIAPDLTEEQLLDIIEIVKQSKIAGVIATNTTTSREGLQTNSKEVEQMGVGGLSGKAVRKSSTEVIRFLHQHAEGAFDIIGVGGIFTAADAIEKLEAGAKLVQVYTGFVYEGPAMVKNMNRGILKWKRNQSLHT